MIENTGRIAVNLFHNPPYALAALKLRYADFMRHAARSIPSRERRRAAHR
jgi:hypothetical protein